MPENQFRPQLEELYNYPFIRALVERRSRRFPLGCEIQNGPLKYKSNKEPVPLNSLETALLCYAGAGSTGLALGDLDTTHSSNMLMNWPGRSCPSPCNNHQLQLLFTNDDGLYLYKPRQAEETVEIKSIDDLVERVSSFDRDIVKLKDGRLGLPDGPPAIGLMNKGTVNRTGQTMFIPIAPTAHELIVILLSSFQYDRYNMIDDDTRKPAGIEKWVSKLNLGLKVPVSVLERTVFAVCILEAGLMCQNILLTAQALGLGAFPPGGYTSLVVMGGTPVSRGLGFRFTSDKKGLPNPVGIDGVLEGYHPPYYKSMDEAVDTVVREKFGQGRTWSPDAKATPFLDHAAMAKGIDRIPDEVIQCTKDYCNYIYGKYGRFPATLDSMYMPIWIVAHHLDLDFYEKIYKPGAVSENIKSHLKKWHSA